MNTGPDRPESPAPRAESEKPFRWMSVLLWLLAIGAVILIVVWMLNPERG